ncbi:hypothetical protein BB561_006188 [Smittium simulii]|uniref:Uncharacterized protein n=1 Tax=Smittium simulii TaxID=133385 RepID=A0A2T9Y5Z5_9FUNG|nr:hypothetical protein BB561_006188 [Smittium simulii]
MSNLEYLNSSEDSFENVGELEHYFDDLITEQDILNNEFPAQDFDINKNDTSDILELPNVSEDASTRHVTNVISEQEQKDVFEWVNRFFQSNDSFETEIQKYNHIPRTTLDDLHLPTKALSQNPDKTKKVSIPQIAQYGTFGDNFSFTDNEPDCPNNNTSSFDFISLLQSQLLKEKGVLISSKSIILLKKQQLEREKTELKKLLVYTPEVSDSDASVDLYDQREDNTYANFVADPENYTNNSDLNTFNAYAIPNNLGSPSETSFSNFSREYLERQYSSTSSENSSEYDHSESLYSLDEDEDPDRALQSLKSLLSQYEKQNETE